MKIRNGFVSNSSSCSFCIYGAQIQPKDVGLETCDELETKANKAGFYASSGPSDYGDYIYVGRSLTSIKDDETGKEFKESVEKKMEEVFGKKIDCGIFSEGWYNG